MTVSVAGGGDPDTVDFDPVGDFRITIPANAASGTGTFVLTPEDDRNVESDDTLAVSGVSDLPVTSASVVLADDDEVSTRILLFLSVNPAQASEGGGPVEVTVTAAVDRAVRAEETRVAVSVSPSGDPLAVDFAPVPGFEIAIPANTLEGVAMFTVTPEDDMIVERDETVTVAGTADLPVTPATLTLLDDDEVAGILLSATPAEVAEDGGPALVAVTASLAGGVRQEATKVTVSVSPGGDPDAVDFAPVAGFAITIAAGSANGSGTFTLTPEDDREDESDESLTISGASDLPVTPTSVEIVDDDETAPPALSVADAGVAEGGAELAFVVDLDAPSGEEVTVRYVSADATAEAGSDYEPVSGTLAFAPGEVSKTVRVVVLDDELDEPDETLSLGLSLPRNATLGRASAQGTILDDDEPPVLSIAGASGMEGDGQLDFVISLSGPSIAEVTVRYATRDGTAAAGSDYRPVDGTLTFAPGQVAMTASVAVIDDALDEVDEETFAVALSANTGAPLDPAADRATASGHGGDRRDAADRVAGGRRNGDGHGDRLEPGGHGQRRGGREGGRRSGRTGRSGRGSRVDRSRRSVDRHGLGRRPLCAAKSPSGRGADQGRRRLHGRAGDPRFPAGRPDRAAGPHSHRPRPIWRPAERPTPDARPVGRIPAARHGAFLVLARRAGRRKRFRGTVLVRLGSGRPAPHRGRRVRDVARCHPVRRTSGRGRRRRRLAGGRLGVAQQGGGGLSLRPVRRRLRRWRHRPGDPGGRTDEHPSLRGPAHRPGLDMGGGRRRRWQGLGGTLQVGTGR